MHILAQHQSAGFESILERAPTEEIMVLAIVFIVFSTIALIAMTWFITNTIRSIRITSINANLADKLVRQGVPHQQVEQIVRANQRRIQLPIAGWCSRWQRPAIASTPPGKPLAG